MINKKLIILPFLMLFAFLAAYNYADGKNFVTILNGANFKSSGNENSYSFIGQPVVFTTKENKDSISQSAFASVFYATQSSSITFTNNTDTEPFEDVNIPLNVTINSVNNKKITKVRYQIWQGENADWNDRTTSPEKDYNDFDSLPEQQQKQLKEKSWKKIFDTSPYEDNWIRKGMFVQATFWELKLEETVKTTIISRTHGS